jgi:hypothetical protein
VRTHVCPCLNSGCRRDVLRVSSFDIFLFDSSSTDFYNDIHAKRVVLALGISLDEYIAGRNGAVDFLFMPKDYFDGFIFRVCCCRRHGTKDSRSTESR